MADERQLSTILNSGEINTIYLGGVSTVDKVLKASEIEAKDTVIQDQVDINTADIAAIAPIVGTNTTDITALQAPEKIDFNDMSGSEPTWKKGQIYYANGKLNVDTDFNNVTLQIGEEQHITVYNNSGATLLNGKVVRYAGTASGYPAVELSQADTFDHAKDIGVLTMDIPHGQTGILTMFGLVRGLDLSAFSDGDRLYVSETIAGGYTTTAPDIASVAGIVFSNDAVDGAMFVSPQPHIVLPTVLAFMSGGTIGTTSITAAYQDVGNYSGHGNVVMDYDAASGTITVPSTGIYSITINLNVAFDAVGNSEETFNIRVNGSINGNADIPVNVGRNGGAATAYPTQSFPANAGEVIKIQLGGASDTLTNLVEHMVTIEIGSKHIR